jgi:flagellar motor component MotA
MKRKTLVLIAARIGVLVVLGLAAVLSGKFAHLSNGPGLVFVLWGIVAMALMGFTPREILSSFKHAAGEEGTFLELKRSIYFWQSAARNAMMLGILGTLTGFVVFFCNFQGRIATFLPGVAHAFINMLYGVILGAVCTVPALMLSRRLERIPATEERVEPPSPLGFGMVVGYLLYIGLIGWVMLSPAQGTQYTPLQWFVHWPSLLVVAGGTLALVLFVNDAKDGRSITVSFAFTGLIGTLMGLVQLLQSFNIGIAAIATSMTFIISSCFIALVGMMLVGIPLEDRNLKLATDAKDKLLSRVAWYGFPLLTLFYLMVTVILIITPIKKG